MFTLPRLAVAAWLLATALIALCAALLVGQVWHPHFLPMTSLLVGLFVVGVLLVGVGIRAIFRGPYRRRAAGWLLLGLAPLLIWTGLFTYGLTVGSGRLIKLNLPLKLLIPLAESIMDLEARWRYPQRTSGERVVMISTPIDNAQEQVAAMDEHVRRLESLLGHTIDGQVHWVRGPLLGMSGKAIVGLCMGSRVGEETTEGDGLTILDRHEVAHCVMNRFTSAASEPLALLSEGWAEGHSGISDQRLAARLWDERQRGSEMTLVDLTTGDWPARHEWPVYVHGGPLSRYLIRTFGPDKFIELYATSHCDTFATDCQRILGVSVEELDAAYWQDVERLVAKHNLSPRRVMSQFQLSPDVSPEHWQQFVDGFVQADELRQAAEQRGTVVVEWRTQSNDAAKDEAAKERYTLYSEGDKRLLRIARSGGDEVLLASPERSLHATRLGHDPWQLFDGNGASRERSYRRARYGIDARAFWRELPNEFYREQTPWNAEPNKIVVQRIALQGEGDDKRLRIELIGAPLPGAPASKPGVELEFAPNGYTLRSFEYRSLQSAHGVATYNPHGEISLFESLTTKSKVLGSDETTFSTRVVERSFDDVPEKTFDPSVIFGSDGVSAPPDEMARAGFAWHYIPLACGGLTLLGGLALLLSDRRKS